jgi:serine protease Do
VGADKKADLAVLKIDAKDLPVIAMGDSDQVRAGQFALAVGNPFGVGQTVTMGIIGATGRGGLGIEDYEDFIQTDAAINPGNSGGALVNVKGELIGINTAILSGGGGNQGVGFAIPVNMARQVMNEIVQHGKVTRGWLGVSVQPVTPEIAQVFHLQGEARGALIGDVTKQSPAEKAGLKPGDIVLSLNGSDIRDSRDLSLKVSRMAPGNTAKLKVFRDGKQSDVAVVLGDVPADKEVAAIPAGPANSGPRLGVSVQPLTSDLAEELGLPARSTGLVIVDVNSGSPAEEAGLKRGDVVQEVNRKTVASVADFQQAVKADASAPLLLVINRGGNRHFVTVQ